MVDGVAVVGAVTPIESSSWTSERPSPVSTLSPSGRSFLGKGWRAGRVAKVTSRICLALLLVLHACGGSAETEREPDITVTAERVGKWEMSFEDMEFVTRAISCGKRLYWDGQKPAAWPYLKMGARYGDIDSQFMAAGMLGAGEHVPQDWNAAVGWPGVAAEGNIKPLAQKRLREVRESLCGGRTDCAQEFDAIVADYRHRYGRRATGMACRYSKGQRGAGVLSLRVGEGVAIALDGMKRASVFGSPMAGLRGAIETRTLKHTKIPVRVPAERLYHVDGTPREAFLPPFPAEAGQGDAVLDAAIKRLLGAG